MGSRTLPAIAFVALTPLLASAGTAKGPALSLAAMSASSQNGFASQRDAPRVVLEALDGTRTVRGAGEAPLKSLTGAGAAFARFLDVAEGAPEDAASKKIDARDFASLELVGGDRLAGAVRGGSGDLLQLELKGGVALELSIDSLRSVVFAARIPDRVTTAPVAGPDGDRLYLVAAGSLDRATGFVEEFSAEGVTFEDQRVGSRTYSWDRVAALFINPLEDEIGAGDAGDDGAGKEAGDLVTVSLVGGGRLSGRLVELGSPTQGIRLVLSGMAQVQLPGRIVNEVALDDGSFQFLGELAPARPDSGSPFGDDLGFTWPMRVDRNCQGGLLRVGGVAFARGLGVHAPSELRWDLGGEWRELRFACGVDDSGASGTRAGSVRFRVLGDDKLLWSSEVQRAGEAPLRPAPILLEGVQSLVLEVDPAGDFVLDRANWLRPMLVR